MANPPEAAQVLGKSSVELDWRMEEKVAVREAHTVIRVVNGSGNFIPATVKYSKGPSTMPISGATGLYTLIGS
jgi:hypothetical protein